MVGHNIVDALNNSGHILLTPGSREIDLLNSRQLEEWLKEQKPDMIIHCAGRVGGIQANMAANVEFLMDNLYMGLNLIKAALKTGVKNFLNLASSCMYPCSCETYLTEDMILSGKLEPTNEGYALAKVSITRLCHFINSQYKDCSYKTLIPCNLYGKYDKFDPVNSHMIPAIIRKINEALTKKLPAVEIWGDGTTRREFMYAADLAEFVRMAIDRFSELPEIMNIGMGEDHTVNEYYKITAQVLGYEGTFTHNLEKPTGMRRKLVDISRQKEFGFFPAFSLEEGILETWKWYKTSRQVLI